MNIGRIITNMKTVDGIDFVEKTTKFDAIDDSVPTLIVGKKIAESIYGSDKIKVLDKKISDNVFWTFSKTEKRSEYEKDIEKFKNYIISNIKSEVDYSFYNIFIEKLSRTKRLLRFLVSPYKKVFYISGNHIYLYFNKHTFGFSLEDTSYIGISNDKIISLIKSEKNNTVIYDDNFIPNGLGVKLRDYQYIVPYLYFVYNK